MQSQPSSIQQRQEKRQQVQGSALQPKHSGIVPSPDISFANVSLPTSPTGGPTVVWQLRSVPPAVWLPQGPPAGDNLKLSSGSQASSATCRSLAVGR